MPLTQTAHDRLQTIAQNTALGSGTAVAMKDLEIRGAGNLLGGEQSGHIEGVGFDLYVRMIGEAVSAFKGEYPQEEQEVKVELPIDAHIPVEHIEHERLRLEAYRKIAKAASEADLQSTSAELTDRYGPIPPEVERLLNVARFRFKVKEAGLLEVTGQGKFMRLAPLQPAQSTQLRLRRIYPGTVIKPATREVLVPIPNADKVGTRLISGQPLLTWIEELLPALGPIQPKQ